jgi:rhodanese-related sulfurtransferase
MRGADMGIKSSELFRLLLFLLLLTVLPACKKKPKPPSPPESPKVADVSLPSFPQVSYTDSATSISAKNAWNRASNGDGILLDVREFKDYEARHAKRALSFSTHRVADLERAFPDKLMAYVVLDYGYDSGIVFAEFHRKGYRNICRVDMLPIERSEGSGGNPLNEWETEKLPYEGNETISIGDEIFTANGYDIFVDSLGYHRRLARLPVPTFEQLIRYRPEVAERHHFDTTKYELSRMIHEIESRITVATLLESRLWFGMSFYGGEGNEGYGGVGFFDLSTNALGILRHPALLGCSTRSLLVTDSTIYVATYENHELGDGVGNGLVMLNLRSFQARSVVPPGSSVLWDKDEGTLAGAYYDKSIAEMLQDDRFVEHQVQQFSSEEMAQLSSSGLDQFMIRTTENERRLRDKVFSNAEILQDTLIVFGEDIPDPKPRVYGSGPPIYFWGQRLSECAASGYELIKFGMPYTTKENAEQMIRSSDGFDHAFTWYRETAWFSAKVELMGMKKNLVLCPNITKSGSSDLAVIALFRARATVIKLPGKALWFQ